jgi:hypothetical protein
MEAPFIGLLIDLLKYYIVRVPAQAEHTVNNVEVREFAFMLN